MAYPSNLPEVEKDSQSAIQLRSYIERVERLEEEKKGMMDDIKDIYLEARSQGYDPKAIKKIVAERKKDKDEVEEFEMLVQTYRAAIS